MTKWLQNGAAEYNAGDVFYAAFDAGTGVVTADAPQDFDNAAYAGAAYVCKILSDGTISVRTFNKANEFINKGKKITIPSTICGYTVTEIGKPTGDRRCMCGYSSITVHDTVTTINRGAFAYNFYLEEVIFGENSQLRLIDRLAFQNCRSLKSIIIRILIPVAMRDIANSLKVYHWQDGKYVSMNTRVENGYLVFETEHFSIYVVTAENI